MSGEDRQSLMRWQVKGFSVDRLRGVAATGGPHTQRWHIGLEALIDPSPEVGSSGVGYPIYRQCDRGGPCATMACWMLDIPIIDGVTILRCEGYSRFTEIHCPEGLRYSH
jgi:hypothetical protein